MQFYQSFDLNFAEIVTLSSVFTHVMHGNKKYFLVWNETANKQQKKSFIHADFTSGVFPQPVFIIPKEQMDVTAQMFAAAR